MGPKNILIAGAVVAVLNAAMEEQQPACAVGIPAKSTVAACPDKAASMLHIEQEKLNVAPPPTADNDPFPFLLRNSAANFTNSQYVQERREAPFIQPWRGSNIVVLTRTDPVI
jgi:hypothetical protein